MRPVTLGIACALGSLAALDGCMVGPDYERPPVATPAAYKEQGIWKVGRPQGTASPGAWWSIYHEPLLDGLEHQIDIDNQTLKAAEASYRDAIAVVAQARAGLFPTITATPSERSSKGVTTSTAGSAGISSTSGGTATVPTSSVSGGGSAVRSLYSMSAALSWNIDVWGQTRRLIEGDVASAQASAANLAAARLSAQGALATAYFELRVQDELKRLLDNSAAAYARSLQIVQNQYASGVAARSDVAQAEAQLKSTQAQAINTGEQRAQLEHAIAVLVGLPPASLSIDPEPFDIVTPPVPDSVPSTLLERRPDIAAAERQMAAANAQIGVATAAFFPSLSLSASVGYSGSVLNRLFEAPNQFWSVGPSLAETLFEGGTRNAQLQEARALYDQSVANYRQTVLTSFQQVEDELAALGVLAQQITVQGEAYKAASEAERLIFNQYRAGTVPYTSVVVAQTAALSDAVTLLTAREASLVASVALLQALGGDWDVKQLPGRDKIDVLDPRMLLPIPIGAEPAAPAPAAPTPSATPAAPTKP
ncbi:MAG TPA: efflux transporter outer membrane subunit [Candidatus Sulfotelmatobacter sp.]|nr:efflux transporter outer membrane subunit [Candidatus Sulfotelmatobacter sp.]